MASQRVSCGRDFTSSPDINGTLNEAVKSGFDFACVPIVNPRFKREFFNGPAKNRRAALTRSDMLLTSEDWSSLIVAKMSPWLQMDSTNEIIRKNSIVAFKQELAFASHLSVPAILIPLKGPICANLARVLNSFVLQGHNHQFWIRVPMIAPEDSVGDVFEEEEEEEEEGKTGLKHDTWHWWNSLRLMCDCNKKISIALEVTENLPSSEAIDRWCGEPVKAAILPTSIFLTNKKGYPVLSRAHQQLVKRLFKLDAQMIIVGNCRHGDKGMRSYQQYLDHLWQNQDPPDKVMQFAKGYEDYLQCPLQPLMDNLESQTYEVFEKDPFKYSQYQKAVLLALQDRVKETNSKVVVVMVLGAGRGPLVTASMNAARKADIKIRVYAVEKNPNAVVTLENLKCEVWGDLVTVVSCDMRTWNPPEKADIIVSELLGSFGDNELSPECLDGADRFLKDDGISIPVNYTSFLAPLSSPKLWTETRNCKDQSKPADAPFETPYVVKLHNMNILDTAQPLFHFHHPNRVKGETPDNNRYEVLRFNVQESVLLHGFAGYFECVLYGDVTLSIVPETHSPGMFSWFPMYFPIKEPVFVRSGSHIAVQFWRINDGKKVWYEWCISEPEVKPIHNPNGRAYTIGL